MNSEQTLTLSIDEIGMAILNGEMSSNDLTKEQLAEWFMWEPPPVPLTSFHLGTEEHRREFLWEYYWQGEPTLFTAVAHVWDSLEGQREAHCTLVGLISGTGGKGKTGLVPTLQKFLRQCLDRDPLIPQRSEFATLDDWHRAVCQRFTDDETHARELCERYSDILDGRVPALARSSSVSGQILQGPWK